MSRRHYNSTTWPTQVPHPYTRCFEAAMLLAEGMTVAEAAEQMKVSEKTVEYHVATFFRKADLMPGRVNLAHWFIYNGYVAALPKYRFSSQQNTEVNPSKTASSGAHPQRPSEALGLTAHPAIAGHGIGDHPPCADTIHPASPLR